MFGVGLIGSVGSRQLRSDVLSIQTAPDGSRRIVWMIKRMIKAHPSQDRMTRQAGPALSPTIAVA
jgi:hypothetical protein